MRRRRIKACFSKMPRSSSRARRSQRPPAFAASERHTCEDFKQGRCSRSAGPKEGEAPVGTAMFKQLRSELDRFEQDVVAMLWALPAGACYLDERTFRTESFSDDETGKPASESRPRQLETGRHKRAAVGPAAVAHSEDERAGKGERAGLPFERQAIGSRCKRQRNAPSAAGQCRGMDETSGYLQCVLQRLHELEKKRAAGTDVTPMFLDELRWQVRRFFMEILERADGQRRCRPMGPAPARRYLMLRLIANFPVLWSDLSSASAGPAPKIQKRVQASSCRQVRQVRLLPAAPAGTADTDWDEWAACTRRVAAPILAQHGVVLDKNGMPSVASQCWLALNTSGNADGERQRPVPMVEVPSDASRRRPLLCPSSRRPILPSASSVRARVGGCRFARKAARLGRGVSLAADRAGNISYSCGPH